MLQLRIRVLFYRHTWVGCDATFGTYSRRIRSATILISQSRGIRKSLVRRLSFSGYVTLLGNILLVERIFASLFLVSVSYTPDEEMIGAVISSSGFASGACSEVLVAITATDDQHVPSRRRSRCGRWIRSRRGRA